MTSRQPAPWGDPEDWGSEIPDSFLDALVPAIEEHGWTVLDAHDGGVQVEVAALNAEDDEEWWCGYTSYSGWTYGVTEKHGVVPNPVELVAIPGDPAAVAARINEVLVAEYGPAEKAVGE